MRRKIMQFVSVLVIVFLLAGCGRESSAPELSSAEIMSEVSSSGNSDGEGTAENVMKLN